MYEFELFEIVLKLILIFFSFFLLFIIFERFLLASGREMFTDKFIRFLEGIHNQTAPKCDDKIDVNEYRLNEKLKIMELYIYEQSANRDKKI